MEKLKILNLNFSFQRAAHYHINGGMLLMGVVLLAMFLANSPWGDIYASFWNYEVHLQIGEFNFFSHNGHHMTLMTFINDALMAVFFFSVGLEIKREILVGELSSFRQALLPIVAACGGMLVPVVIYSLLVVSGTPETRGSGPKWSGHTDGYGYRLFAGSAQPVRQAGSAELESLSDRFRCGR